MQRVPSLAIAVVGLYAIALMTLAASRTSTRLCVHPIRTLDQENVMIGRTSMVPKRAPGILAATLEASSTLPASIR